MDIHQLKSSSYGLHRAMPNPREMNLARQFYEAAGPRTVSPRTQRIRQQQAQRATHRAAVAAAPLAVRTAYASIPVALRQRDRSLALQLAQGYAARPGFSPVSFSPEAEAWTRAIRQQALASPLASLPPTSRESRLFPGTLMSYGEYWRRRARGFR